MASPTLGRGGYHGCATWPTITAAAATQGSERAGVQDEGATTAHTLSGASPAHHIHARTQDRRVARAASVLRAQPLSPAPRQRRGGLHGQTERLSAHAGSTQIAGSSQQSGGVTWPPVVAGTQAEVRSGEGKGGGSPARAGRCALRCGRCGGRKEPSPWCVGRGSALPGPLLWARSSAPGAPGGCGRGAPPRARPARGSAAPGRLGAERRCHLRSRAAACGTWAFSRSPRAQVADAPEPAQLPQLDRCCARAARRRRTARAPLPLPRRPPPRSQPAPPNDVGAPCCRPAQRELTRRRLLLWRRARTAISQAGRRGRARW